MHAATFLRFCSGFAPITAHSVSFFIPRFWPSPVPSFVSMANHLSDWPLMSSQPPQQQRRHRDCGRKYAPALISYLVLDLAFAAGAPWPCPPPPHKTLIPRPRKTEATPSHCHQCTVCLYVMILIKSVIILRVTVTVTDTKLPNSSMLEESEGGRKGGSGEEGERVIQQDRVK